MIKKLIKYMDDNPHKCHVIPGNNLCARPESTLWINGSKVILVNDQFLVHYYVGSIEVFHKTIKLPLGFWEGRKLKAAFTRCQKAIAEIDLR